MAAKAVARVKVPARPVSLAAQERNREAAKDFNAVYAENKDRTFRLFLRITGDRQEAEDLSQELFLKVWRYLPGFRGDALVSTWIRSLANGLIIDRWTKIHALSRTCEGTVSLDEPIPVKDGGEQKREIATPEDVFVNVQRRDKIDRALEFLKQRNEKQYLAILLHCVQGLSEEEGAKIMCCERSTFKTYVLRGRRMLQERFIV